MLLVTRVTTPHAQEGLMGNHQAALKLHRSRSRLVAHEVTAYGGDLGPRPTVIGIVPFREQHRRGGKAPQS